MYKSCEYTCWDLRVPVDPGVASPGGPDRPIPLIISRSRNVRVCE